MASVEDILTRIQIYKGQGDPNQPIDARAFTQCAVLIALSRDAHGTPWSVLLTLRSKKLNSWAGDVCLPGGKLDHPDETVVQAALREAQEEVGLKPEDLQVLGILNPVAGLRNVLVWPVVAVIVSHNVQLVSNPDEVQLMFFMPLNRFLMEENHRMTMSVIPGLNVYVHFFDFEGHDGHMYTVFGITARIMAIAAAVLCNRSPAFCLDPPDAQNCGLPGYGVQFRPTHHHSKL